MRNPALASTFERILRLAQAASANREAQIEAAHRAFYQGFVAESIDRFLSTSEVLDSTGQRHRGLLSAGDLAARQPEVEEPCGIGYGTYTVFKPGPWSQGPVFLQQLAILDGLDLRAAGLGSAEYVHAMAEAAKLAFADREAWYGDPRHTQVPMAELLAPAYSAMRRALIGDRAADDPAPGTPGDRSPGFRGPTRIRRGRKIQSGWSNCATGAHHRSVGGPYGGGQHLYRRGGGRRGKHGHRGAQRRLAQELAGDPRPRVPARHPGPDDVAVRRTPQLTRAGKRPRTTLSPGIVLRDGEPFLALGTPGGDQQDQWTLQTFLAVAEFGLDLQAATELPAFHIDHFPQSFAPRTSRPGVVAIENRTIARSSPRWSARGISSTRCPPTPGQGLRRRRRPGPRLRTGGRRTAGASGVRGLPLNRVLRY